MSATMQAVLVARLAMELETAQQHIEAAQKLALEIQELG